ncbi:MAG: PopZ family protein [Rickettsia endosymbiont of Sergentomyia squamirostris]|uniref:PopZ family protein n=1 Tax=Candidatus Tisiphia endosymbiont of Sergentomyia squamirostris TaxID=3113639 RepID=A0AAT9G9P8_9RICK
MSKDHKKNQDMSVEEILKSIKGMIDSRGIVNSGGLGSRNGGATPICNRQASEDDATDFSSIDYSNQSNDDEILELTNIVEDEANKLENNRHSELEGELLQTSLVSDKSAAETTKIFQHFSKTAQEISANASNPTVKTLEDIIIEMLRPQLSQWLNTNLPLLVKQLVEKEIQKLIPNDKK